MPNRENIVQLRLQHNLISLMRSDGLPRGPEEGSAEMVSFGRWQGRPGLPGGGECWCRPPAPPRLASAPCTGCCQACQPSRSSLTSCATSSSTRATRHHPPGGSMYGRPPPPPPTDHHPPAFPDRRLERGLEAQDPASTLRSRS